MKILIIDDDVDLLEMIVHRIDKRGFTTLGALNLSEAEKAFQKNSDIIGIICDFYLQNGESGLTFYEQHVKNKFKGKFILATGCGFNEPKIAKYSKEDELFYCVEKPYSIDQILEVLTSSN